MYAEMSSVEAGLKFKSPSGDTGTISVSGSTVSYNAFTGSHYAWSNENIERGILVSLTGVNKYLEEKEVKLECI